MNINDTQRLLELHQETLSQLNAIKNSQSVHVGNNQVLTRLFTGQKIFVDALDISVSPSLMLDGHWEEEVTAVLRHILKPSDSFIDVGANMGYFGIIAGTIIDGGQGGSIHMIEANPRLVPLIFKSINVTGLLGTAAVANFAISDQSGEVELQLVKDLLGSSSLVDLDTPFKAMAEMTSTVGFEVEEKITVPAITLDAYAEMESLAKVDVVKIDIEGHEEFAYAGMTKIIDENRDDLRLMIEYSRGQYRDPVSFLQQIQDDFKFVYAIEHGSGRLVELTAYDQVVDLAGNSWVMLVAANREIHG